MSGLIKISGSGKSNKKPIITDFVQFGEIGIDSFSIKYTAIDKDNIPLKHYLYVNGTKRDISKDVGADRVNREFTYTLSGLEPKTEYNLQLEITDGFITTQSSIIKVTTKKILVYGVRVDESNSNPESCVTYIEDAVGVSVATPTSLGGWSKISPFNKVKLVGFKNGQETGDINPNNKTKYLNGQTVPQDVDVMSRIPKIYWDFTSTSNGYELRISENRFNDTCDCYAHKVGEIEKDYIYIGSYLGCVEGNKLRSRSEVLPTIKIKCSTARDNARANGSGYQQFNLFTLVILQILYLIIYKNLNSQESLGMGYTSINNRNNHITGGTNKKGLVYGEKTGIEQMCFLGIEDLWGNCNQWIDGIYCDNSLNILVTPNNKIFNNDGTSYINTKVNCSISSSSGASKVSHTNLTGFIPISSNGSETTYYCDYCNSGRKKIASTVSDLNSMFQAGIFSINIDHDDINIYSQYSGRLCYLG